MVDNRLSVASVWSDALSDAVLIFDRERRLAYANPAAEHLLGIPAATMVGRTIAELAERGDGLFGRNRSWATVGEQTVEAALEGRAWRDDDAGVINADETLGPHSWRADPVRVDGTVIGAAIVIRDTTESANAAFHAARVGMVRVRGDGELLEVNAAFREMLKVPAEQSLRKPFRSLLHPGDASAFTLGFAELAAGRAESYRSEHRLLGNGAIVWANLTMTMPYRRIVGADEARYERVIGMVEDITRRKRLEAEVQAHPAQMEMISRLDSLTGLANRHHLETRVPEMASLARRHTQGLSALIFDLDETRLINDRYGQEAGDQVIRTVAERLRDGCRAEDVVGRWSGEEFLILAPFTGLDGARVLAERQRMSIGAAPVTLSDGTLVPVTVSVGVASAGPDHFDTLLKRVEAAVDEAKAAGRDQIYLDNTLL